MATWQRTRLPIGHRTPVRAGELRDQDQCHPPSGGWHWPEWIAEAVGTAALFGIGFSVVAVLLSQRSPIADAVHGIRFLLVGVNFGVLSAAIAVSPLGRRSGAHLNPAVTLGFWLRGSVHPHDLAGYLAAQFCGALAGTWASGFVLGRWATSIHRGRTSPNPVGTLPGVAIEAGLTFVLLGTVFACVGTRRLLGWTPAIVAIVLTILIWVGSPLTGASMNPARSFAPALLESNPDSLWVYFAGPAIGAFAAAVAGWRRPMTAKLVHDPRYRSTMRCSAFLGAQARYADAGFLPLDQ